MYLSIMCAACLRTNIGGVAQGMHSSQPKHHNPTQRAGEGSAGACGMCQAVHTCGPMSRGTSSFMICTEPYWGRSKAV
jgi:hypothetical protein